MSRSIGRCVGLTAGLLLALPSLALAHTGAGPTHSLVHGFMHPLSGLDHLLAMLAVGLWAGQIGGRSVWLLPVTFVGAMVAAGALGVAGVGLPAVELGIAVSVLVLGALIAAAARPALLLGAGAVAVFALFHGYAHGSEMAATATAVYYGAGFAATTALLHAAGVGLVVLAHRARAGRRLVWVRATGAAIGLAGVAFLF
jgi:urease accessory protein